MQILYQISSGVAPFTAHITPQVAADQVHNTLGTFSFDDLPDNLYELSVTDDKNCNVLLYSGETTTTTSTTSTTTSSTTTTTTTAQPIEDINYGLLYNWYMTQGTDGASVTSSNDWVIPSVAQGTILQNYYGGQLLAGEHLKEASLTYWTDITTATNSSNFNGRGSGLRSSDGLSFTEQKNRMWGWLSNSSDTTFARNFQLRTLETSFYLNENRDKKSGFAIRLLKTSTTLTHGQTGTYVGNDGKIYRTICIGTQEWLADNLAETKYRNGDDIPEVTDGATWAGLTTGALCAYNNNWANV